MENASDTTAAPQSHPPALLSYAILTGLTPLIPVPLADDLAKSYFRRRLIHLLAQAHGLDLSRESVNALAREQSRGCLGGCLGQMVVYPMKKLFGKIFFFLEWKRAVDLTSYTYHYGYLVDHAFGEGLAEPLGTHSRAMDDLRAAIERACEEAPIRPVEEAVRATFRQSRAVLLSAARRIEWSVRGAAAARRESAQQEAVSGVAALLQQRIGAVPEAHFRELRGRFARHLAEVRNRSQGAG